MVVENGENMKTAITRSESMNDLFEVIKMRRAVRKYKAHKIPRGHLKKMLDAARLAPSANNSQPWRFIVVEDKKTKELLAKPSAQSFISKANTIVVVLGDSKTGCCQSVWTTHDPMIATEHLVLAATALGYGTCWIANYKSRSKSWEDEVRKTMKIPDHMDIIVLLAIGVPDEAPQPRPRKPLEEICFAETYGRKLRLGQAD